MSGGSPDQGLPIPPPVATEIKTPLEWLKVFYPAWFDSSSSDYVPPEIVDAMLLLAESARPHCLPMQLQNYAVAMYAAYLIEVWKNDTSQGGSNVDTTTKRIVLSEKEGDVAITYADPSASGAGGVDTSAKQPSTAWERWNNLYKLCSKGAITTRIAQRY